MDVSSLATPFLWIILKTLFILGALVLIVGLFIGIFTQGRPLPKRRKEPEALEAVFEIGIMLSHLAIDRVLGKRRANRNEWHGDRQLIAYLRGMKPSDFEEYVAELFQKLGYKTQVVGGKSDGGIDVIAVKDGVEHYVQCKKYITSKVSVGEMRDFYGALAGSLTDGKGFFITTGVFTLEAEQFAENKPIELIDQFKLIKLIRSCGLTPAASAEEVPKHNICPKCGQKLVPRKSKYGEFMGCSFFPKCRYIQK